MEEILEKLARSPSYDMAGETRHLLRMLLKGTIAYMANTELPSYDGSSAPQLWLKKCDWLFDFQRVADVDKVAMAAFHLKGEALSWFIVLERYEEDRIITWEDFKSFCCKRFGSKVGEMELAELHQTGTVTEYQSRFEQLCARDSALTHEEAVKIFINGLKEEIGVRVKSDARSRLRTAMSFGQIL